MRDTPKPKRQKLTEAEKVPLRPAGPSVSAAMRLYDAAGKRPRGLVHEPEFPREAVERAFGVGIRRVRVRGLKLPALRRLVRLREIADDVLTLVPLAPLHRDVAEHLAHRGRCAFAGRSAPERVSTRVWRVIVDPHGGRPLRDDHASSWRLVNPA
jgi:hypothetical protein